MKKVENINLFWFFQNNQVQLKRKWNMSETLVDDIFAAFRKDLNTRDGFNTWNNKWIKVVPFRKSKFKWNSAKHYSVSLDDAWRNCCCNTLESFTYFYSVLLSVITQQKDNQYWNLNDVSWKWFSSMYILHKLDIQLICLMSIFFI